MTQQDSKIFYMLPNPIQDAWLHAILYSDKHRKFYRNILDTFLSKWTDKINDKINLDKDEKKDWGYIPAKTVKQQYA